MGCPSCGFVRSKRQDSPVDTSRFVRKWRRRVSTEQKFHGTIGLIEKIGTSGRSPLLEPPPDHNDRWPLVSIVLPTWREERYIQTCLECILGQDYPAHRLEVLVVDGMSDDRTREIVRGFSKQHPQIRLLDNRDRLQSPGLNLGIQASRGSIVVRMDAHSEYAPDYIRKCVETLRLTGSDNVGGPQRPRARNFFQRMVACALDSRLGTGGAAFRHAGRDGYVDTVFPGAFRREALRRVGLFDPGAITNEDAEINQRIIESGGKIYLNSDIQCYYYPRESFRSLAWQYFRYGRGRARTFLKHRNVLRISSFVPFLFVFGCLSLLLLGLIFSAALWAAGGLLGVYALGLLGESARLAVRQDDWHCTLWLPPIFAASHVPHAFGVAWGLAYYTFNPDWKRLAPPALRE